MTEPVSNEPAKVFGFPGTEFVGEVAGLGGTALAAISGPDIGSPSKGAAETGRDIDSDRAAMAAISRTMVGMTAIATYGK